MAKSAEDILLEMAQLQARLDEAEQLLRTLGPELANLSDKCRQADDPDLPDPHVPSQIPEGAAVLTGSGRILCCNSRFARMLHVPPSQLLGSSMYQHLASDHEAALASLLHQGSQDQTSGHIHLTGGSGRTRNIHITVQPAAIEGMPGACMILVQSAKGRHKKPRRQADRQRYHCVATIAEREQQQIGQDLKDVLGQTLAAIALLGKALHQRLQVLDRPEVAEVEQIVNLVSQGLKQLRGLATSLQAVEPHPDGLRKALGEYAADVESLDGVACRFEWDGQIQVDDPEVATHLYRIAQEAVRNAVGHGKATRIMIRLAKGNGNGRLELDITSDGIDFPAETAKRGSASRIMNQRASAIGASLWIRRGRTGEARVTCSVPGSMGAAEVQSGYDNATGSDK
jgi:signal transduction histidine kinase